MKVFTAKIIQNGLEVVRVDSSSQENCEREISHYAMMYAEEGKMIIKRNYKLKGSTHSPQGEIGK